MYSVGGGAHSLCRGLEYSGPVSGEVRLDDPSEDVEALPAGFGRSSVGDGGAAACWPSSASFFRRFITVGRSFVDTDSKPGS